MRILLYLLFFFILLSPCYAVQIIPPIVLTANARNHLDGTSTTIVTHQEMAAKGVTSLSQALQSLGGVQLQDMVGNGSQVGLGMRGFGTNASSNTLLLVNGIPLTNPDMMPPDLNAIPLDEIRYIEVFAGSESVLYGDQAVGGTINIVTREDEKNNANVSCSGGSYHQRSCYATLTNRFKQLRYAVNVLNLHTDNYRARNDYDQNLLSGWLKYFYQTGQLSFNYRIANERMLYPGALTAAQVAQNRRQAADDTDFFRNWNGFYQISSSQQLGPIWNLETDFVRREMHGDGVLTSPFTQSRITHFIKPQLKGTLGNATVISGVDFENDSYHLGTTFGVTNNVIQKYSIYGLVKYPMTSQLSLSLGARGAQQNNDLEPENDSVNHAIATTLGAVYQFTPHIEIYLRRAESFRFPKVDELTFTPSNTNELKTQHGVSYETGIESHQHKLTSKLGVYQLNLVDEITFDPTQTPQAPFGTNRNLDPTVRQGFSVSEKYQLSDNASLGAQFNHVNARFQSGPNSGNRIPLVAENIFHAGIDYAFNSFWNLYTEAVYTGSQYAANDDANVAGTSGGYTVYNFNLRYRYQHWTASCRVNNIFNKYYYFYTVFNTFMLNESFYPAPGRNFMLKVQYDFG